MTMTYCKNNWLIVGFLILCTAVILFTFDQYQTTTGKHARKQVVRMYPTLLNLSALISTQNKSGTRKPEYQRTSIPKILHQIWNDEAIPEVFQENIRGLVAHNKPPKWKYYFWTIATGTRLIKKVFPNLLDRYLKADSLLKADILRLAVLYHFGGVYFDLDTVSVKPLDPFVESNNCSFVTDPEGSSRKQCLCQRTICQCEVPVGKENMSKLDQAWRTREKYK